LFEYVEESAVAIQVRTFAHTIEIADGLVVVKNDDQSQIRTHVNHPCPGSPA